LYKIKKYYFDICSLQINDLLNPEETSCNNIFDAELAELNYENENENQLNKRIKTNSFKQKWLSEYKWLHYDHIHKRMFCTICIQHKRKNQFAQEGL
jgi:hypothetical protein